MGLTNGGIYNNRLLFESNRLFPPMFSGNFYGGQGRDLGGRDIFR